MKRSGSVLVEFGNLNEKPVSEQQTENQSSEVLCSNIFFFVIFTEKIISP